jgi:hypothetical protein
MVYKPLPTLPGEGIAQGHRYFKSPKSENQDDKKSHKTQNPAISRVLCLYKLRILRALNSIIRIVSSAFHF